MLAGFAYEPEVESKIVDTEYLQSEHLLCMDEVAYIRTGIVMIHKTGATRVQFGEVIFPLFVAQVHHAVLCEDHTIAAIAGWLILGQNLSPREIIGCVIMFVAIIIAQVPIKLRKKEV